MRCRAQRTRRYDVPSVTGSSGNRAERTDERAVDPPNLIWVMPAEEDVPNGVVVVVAGGSPPAAESVRAVPGDARVIAADKGLEHALALGLAVEIAVGDFDSASPEAVAVAEEAGTRIERHPAEKDATDLELALDRAAALDPERVLVLAGDGGRLDHLLSTLLLLGSPRYAQLRIDAFVGPAQVHVVRDERELAGRPGELVSLLALHGRGGRRSNERARVSARRRDARARIEPGRLERLRRPSAARVTPRRGRPPRREAGAQATSCHEPARPVRLAKEPSDNLSQGVRDRGHDDCDGLALAVTGCGGDDEALREVVLVTHDSFAVSDDVKQAFEAESGLTLRILQAGDAGEIVTRALLTAGDPEGDVLFGVDSNLLSRALEGDVFEPYESSRARAAPTRRSGSTRSIARRRSTTARSA